eukprot:237684-Rhodomonas_salina.1
MAAADPRARREEAQTSTPFPGSTCAASVPAIAWHVRSKPAHQTAEPPPPPLPRAFLQGLHPCDASSLFFFC